MPYAALLLAALALAGCRTEARDRAPRPMPWDEIARIDPATYAVPPPCGGRAQRLDGECADPLSAYAVGGRTFVVDQRHARASDAGPGTSDRPWRTISRAARAGVLHPGDAVVVRAGVYREAVRPRSGGAPGRPVTFAAWPGESVVISGADPAGDGWQRVGGAWRRAWTGEPMEAYSDDPVFRRELVVADGRVLLQATSRQSLAPGTFWVEGPDTAPVAYWVRFDGDRSPSAARPEIGRRDVLFGPVGADPYAECGSAGQPGHVRVVGFTLRHAANRAQTGALCAGGRGSRVEDVAVEWTNGTGIDASGDGHVFLRARADHNGQLGWMGHGRGGTIEDGSAVGNNWKGYDAFWEAGGGKWDRTSDLVIRRHYAAWNGGPGIWLDGDNDRNTIEGSLLVANAGAGVMLELRTSRTLVQHNVVRGTRWLGWTGSGVLSQAASANVIVHNTITGSEGIGVWLRLDDERRAPEGSTTVARNRIVGNAAGPHEAREIAVEGASPDNVATHRIDGNVYGAVGGADPTMRSAFYAYAPGGLELRSDRLADWQRATGFDARSVQAAADRGVHFRVPPAGAPRAGYGPYGAAGADPARVRSGG